jgi:PAS domain S-box-containing protein
VRGEQVILSTFVDITERKRAEEALKASEEQFRALADSIPNLAWWANGDGYITWYNRRWYEYTGTTREQMEGWGWQSVHDPEALPKVLERWTASITTGEPFDMEFPLRGADGVFRTFLTRVMPLKDSTGRVVRWFGTNTDVSALKRAEESLRASEARFRTLFETMTEGFSLNEIILDDAGKPVDLRYLSVNPAFESHTGLKATDIVGRTTRELFPEAEPVWFERYGRVALTGEPAHFEERFGPLNKWFEVSAYQTEHGRFAVVFFDITERKKTEADVLKLSEEMATRNRELESVNKELEAFIYSISHDLRAPIRTMSGFAKIMSEDYAGKLDATGQDYLNRILKGSAKSIQLIDDLLHLSKISRQELDRAETDLSKRASKVVEQLREMNQVRNVEVIVQEGLTASVDPRLIELVLTNLLGNAWKFTSRKEKGRIEFGSMQKDGKTVYYVRDNGAGFDMTYSNKMFWPFHRLHADKDFEGTGIGLTIVERIIHRHGGKVWAEGEVGQGATVYFTLG